MGVELWTFFDLRDGGSTYMRIDVYASIYATIIIIITVVVIGPIPVGMKKVHPASNVMR